MPDIGQLLQVLHDSRGSWSTFRGEYRLWRNRERSQQAYAEIPREDESTIYGSLKLARKGDAEPPPAVSEGRCASPGSDRSEPSWLSFSSAASWGGTSAAFAVTT